MEARIPVENDEHLRPLIERVAHGDSVIITQNGAPVARVISMTCVADMDAKNAVEEMLTFRKGHSLRGLSIKDLINEGRP